YFFVSLVGPPPFLHSFPTRRSSDLEGTIRTLSFFGALLTMFITMNAIPLEIDRRTVYTLLSKPLERYQFVLGKFLGCLLLLALRSEEHTSELQSLTNLLSRLLLAHK